MTFQMDGSEIIETTKAHEAVIAIMGRMKLAVEKGLIESLNVSFTVVSYPPFPEEPGDYTLPPPNTVGPQYCGTTYSRLGGHTEPGVSSNALAWSLGCLVWEAVAYAAAAVREVPLPYTVHEVTFTIAE